MLDLELLKKNSSARKYEDGQVIIRDGDSMGDEMFIILAGGVGVYKNYREPNEVKIAELKPGSFFGEMTLFLNKERTATVVAHGSFVMLLVINRLNAYHVFETQPALVYSLVQTLCQRLDDANKYRSGAIDDTPETTESADERTDEEPSIPAGLAGLFPDGHKAYTLAPKPTDKSIVYTKGFTCPLCDEVFSANSVRTTRLKVNANEKDFRVRHEGIDVIYFEIISCPYCCFSTFENSFKGTVLQRFKQNKGQIGVYKEHLNFTTDTERNINEVFEGYYLALKCAELFYPQNEVSSAKIWVRLMWLYRDCGDGQMEQFAAKKAQEAYITVFKETEAAPDTLQQISILIGELSLFLNDLANAKRFFVQARGYRHENPKLISQAEDGIEKLREMERK